ncbi:MAG: GNAT family N-acetyltransferase [Bdellovibrionota bacterium]
MTAYIQKYQKDDHFHCFAIIAKCKIIGFFALDFSSIRGKQYHEDTNGMAIIKSFLIDQKYQGMGWGGKALHELLCNVKHWYPGLKKYI